MERQIHIPCDGNEEAKIYHKIHEYFTDIQIKIDKDIDKLIDKTKNLSQHPYFERKCIDLPRQGDKGYTDEKMHMLLYKQHVAAIVTQTRNDFNDIHFSFFDNLEYILNKK